MKRVAQFAFLLCWRGHWILDAASELLQRTDVCSCVSHGVQSRSVAVSGYRVHYNAQGPADGPAVVLVHGLGGRAEDWRELSPYLAKAGFRVYMPICPAMGEAKSLRISPICA